MADFRAHGMMDWAAALTYYSVLSIFPALIVLLSIMGVVGDSATTPILDNLEKVGPGPAHEIVDGGIENIQKAGTTAGALLVVSLAVALWTASGYVGAFMRASNAIYAVPEERPMWKTLPVRLGLTLVLLLLVAAVRHRRGAHRRPRRAGGKSGGPGLSRAGGMGGGEVAGADAARLVSVRAALLGRRPASRRGASGCSSPGGIVAVLVWVAASAGFAFYVSNFGSYNETYGSIGGVIVFLVWLWISNMAVLLGAELNAQTDARRAG